MKSRDFYTYTGIRIYFSNVGRGHKASMYNVFIQLYTAMLILYLIFFFLLNFQNFINRALIGGAKLITDFLMLHFYREKKHYSSMKQVETKDMND
jgi:hypothetical protein